MRYCLIGLVSTLTGVGASWGVPLLVLGTALNAYSCGMFDDLGTDHLGYSNPVNQISFFTSMALCGLGGGAEAAAGRASLNAMGSVERNRIIHTSVDVVETCFNGGMAETKIYGYSNEPMKFVLDTSLKSQSTKGKIRRLARSSYKSILFSIGWDFCRYLNDEGAVISA